MREKIKPECYGTHAFTDMTLELLKGMQRQLFGLQTDKKKTQTTKVITTIRK